MKNSPALTQSISFTFTMPPYIHVAWIKLRIIHRFDKTHKFCIHSVDRSENTKSHEWKILLGISEFAELFLPPCLLLSRSCYSLCAFSVRTFFVYIWKLPNHSSLEVVKVFCFYLVEKERSSM